MASATSPSLLESLPPELFNRVLGYVLELESTPEMKDKFRRYRSDTAILRVKKAIHALAKGYLHHSISWIRLDVNWDAFSINPHWVGTKYVAIDRMEQSNSLPLVYGDDSKARSVKQDVPDGRISAGITFPPPTTDEQKVMKKKCFHSPFGSFMRLLVLENYLNRFLIILRMNDLAYCDRLSPLRNSLASIEMAIKQY